MISSIKEARLASILAWGSLAVTLIVTDRISSEPVNLGKMLVLSAVGFGILPLIFSNLKNEFREQKLLVFGVFFFLVTSFLSVFTSENPIERGFYGAFGRNTGFLSYFLLATIFLAAAQLTTETAFKKIVKALIAAGLFNVTYCIFARTGNDIFTWTNPSNAIMGTFGNSNFIGAFMGMFIGALCVLLVENIGNTRKALFFLATIILSFYVVFLSDALQGLLVSVFGVALVLFFYLRSKPVLNKFSNIYLLSGFLVSLISLAGILNKGPLSSLLYKPSVTFRWEYWSAGLNMGVNNPILGVGIDAYGTYYRTYRNESATVFPGVDVITDAAHNVVIDIFAGTGVFGLASYLMINAIVLKYAYSYIKMSRKFDPVFLSLVIPWLGYQLQSIISINQLGLAVWGWVLGGAIVGYVRSRSKSAPNAPTETNSKVKKKNQGGASQMLPAGTALSVFASVVVGILIALPPFVADAKIRSIMSGKSDSATLISHVKAFPVDMKRINRGIVALSNSGLNVQAAELALYGTTRFPNDYASWYSLYELSGPGTPDSEIYRKKLHEIDPFNPKYFDK